MSQAKSQQFYKIFNYIFFTFCCQALREELHRQRTSLMTAQSTTPDPHRSLVVPSQMKQLEDKVIRYVLVTSTLLLDFCIP